MTQDARAELRDRAFLAHQKNQTDEALRLYSVYLASYPDDGLMWTNLGVLHRASGRLNAAYAAQKKAFHLIKDDPSIWRNLANVTYDLGRFDEVLHLRKMIAAKFPDDTSQHAIIGRCYRGLGMYQASLDYLTPRVDQFPEQPNIKLELALTHLYMGHYGRGFENFDARWQVDPSLTAKNPFEKWDPGMSIANKSLLILPERSLGETVMMARFLPELAHPGSSLRMVADKALLRLLDEFDCISWLGDKAAPTDPVDLWVGTMDLPRLMFPAHRPSKIPKPVPFELPDDAIARAKSKTAGFKNVLKVGVAWSDSRKNQSNDPRYFSHDQLLRFAQFPDVQLFSLNHDPNLTEYKNDGSPALMLDTGGTDFDFADTAAVIQEMDLVICPDSIIAHLAGTYGVPTWTLLHWDAHWLYGRVDRTDWYPSMHLFRQKQPMNWTSVFNDVETALKQVIKTRKS